MSESIDSVVVVGGGTAGWIGAAVLAKQLGSNDNTGVKVTLVESPDIPIIGVGEGTWPNLRKTLLMLGVDEGEFMRECDATFKQGAKFVNWIETPLDGKENAYYHPLNTVFHASYEFNLSPYWLLGHAGEGVAYDQAVASQSRICDLGLAPKKITTPAYDCLQEYSYHLNAVKFAAFLKKHCVEKLGVTHIYANIEDVKLDEDEFIESLVTDNKEEIKADFFLDCSGSTSILLKGVYNIPWININDIILNDTAIAMQVPYANENTPIKTHTVMTAEEAGWIWDIGLKNRRGLGYVYGSQYTSHARAEEVLRNHIGKECEGIEVRKFGMDLGYREKFWHKNCVAIGMSAAFVEPLEASAIFLFDAAANMIADQFPRTREAMLHVEKKYNRAFEMRLERTVDFIKMHYCISKRRDSQYWIDNCDNATIPDRLLERLDHWRSHPPTKYDFEYSFEPFNLDSYLYVLYGMQFETKIDNNKSAFTQSSTAKKMFKHIDDTVAKLKRELPQQRELVEKVYEYGFQDL